MVSTFLNWRLALTCALVFGPLSAHAQPAHAEERARAAAEQALSQETNDELTAELFYDLLISELAASQGDATSAVALMLEAARELNREILFERATEIALQGRSGQQALRTAKTWQMHFPKSRLANRYVLQILLTLNRISETQEALAREIAWTPLASKPSAYATITQLYRRASNKTLAAAVVEQALQKDLANDALAGPAWAAIGTLRLQAQQNELALQALRHAHEKAPNQIATAVLALELLQADELSAEPLLQAYMEHQPAAAVELSYAQVLLEKNRLADAQAQLSRLLAKQPEMADAWMAQANLFAQQAQWEKAQQALAKIEPLLQSSIDNDAQRNRALTPAYILGARIALQQKEFQRALQLLEKISSPSDLFMVENLKAHALAKQGKLAQGRALIRAIPAQNTEQKIHKRKAEVALLRDNGASQEAYLLQRTLYEQFPNDVDIAYDTAILADSAGQFAAMEKILRSIIAKQPNFAHALNALGYSLANRGINLHEAQTLIEDALALEPDDPLIADSLGWVQFRLGNLPEALRILEKAYEQRQDAEIAAHLGEVLWISGNTQRALMIWRQGFAIDPDNELLGQTLRRFQVKL